MTGTAETILKSSVAPAISIHQIERGNISYQCLVYSDGAGDFIGLMVALGRRWLGCDLERPHKGVFDLLKIQGNDLIYNRFDPE